MKITLNEDTSSNWRSQLTLLVAATLTMILTTGATKPAGGAPDIPLCVTIHSLGALASDGQGKYCDGQKGVTAKFTGSQGRFSFDTGSTRKANVTIPGYLAQGNDTIHFLVSRDHQDPNVNDPALADPHWQDLHLEQLPVGASVPVGLLFFVKRQSSDTGEWEICFGDYPLATAVNSWPCSAATPAIVTRTAQNTWTFISDDTAADHCLYFGFQYLDRIHFPFAMTLEIKK